MYKFQLEFTAKFIFPSWKNIFRQAGEHVEVFIELEEVIDWIFTRKRGRMKMRIVRIPSLVEAMKRKCWNTGRLEEWFKVSVDIDRLEFRKRGPVQPLVSLFPILQKRAI